MTKKLLIGISITTLLLFSGCGGSSDEGSSAGDTPNLAISNAFLSDSRIAGVTYTCGTTTGVTDSEGKFSYSDECTEVLFSIGGVSLGSIPTANITPDTVLYPSDLLGLDRNNTSDPQLTNMLQFFQSLDSDLNPNNGINIDSNTTSNLESTSLDLDSNVTTLSDINTTLISIGSSLIAKNDAIAHYEDTLRQELNISVDTVAPAAPILLTQVETTNQNSIEVEINGEVGAEVFVNGISSAVYINSSNSALITLALDTAINNGDIPFLITLKDALNQESSALSLVINRDTISPSFTLSDVAIDENTQTVVTVNATDTHPITYSIDGVDANSFTIDTDSGVLSLNATSDYETISSYNINVIATDSVSNNTSEAITITINPQNDIAPLLNIISDSNISENYTGLVTTLSSSDADMNQTQVFTYSIAGTDAASFSVDPTTGALSLTASSDYENQTSYSLTAVVSDGVHSSNIENILINVMPMNDIAPILGSIPNSSISENYTGLVTTLSSSDADMNQTQVFTYSIAGTDAASFSVDPTTGVLSLTASSDYESQTSYSLTAVVSDGVHNSNIENIVISVTHSNDETPVISSVDTHAFDENSALSINITSTDNDIDETQNISYILGGADSNKFNFNTSTGQISFITTPDYENPSDTDKNNIYNLTIQVTDGINTSPLSNLTININNIDDVPTPEVYASSVRGTINNGQAIANATIVIQDINQNLLTTLSAEDGSFSFDLNSSFSGPFMFKAFTPANEIFYSYNDGTKAVTNITPITSLVIADFVVNLNLTMEGLFANFGLVYADNSNFQTLFDTTYTNVSSYFSSYLINIKLSGFNHFYNFFFNLGFDYDSVLNIIDMQSVADVVIIRFENNIYSSIPNINIENVTISGRILDANENPLDGVSVSASYGETLLTSTTVDGLYSFSVPNYTAIDINVSYLLNNITYYALSTFFSRSENVQQVDAIQFTQESDRNASISGYVYNGRTTNTKIPEVTLTVRDGYNNKYGTVIQTLTTDETGNYALSLANGNYTFQFSKNEWTTEFYNIVVNGDNSTYNYYINAFNTNYLASNAYVTAVLTWGDRPSDLDTHLSGPSDATNNRFHSYYGNQVIGTTPADRLNPCNTSGTIASLDVDDTSAYGPETMTICQRFGAVYHYYIYNFSGSPYFDVSNAKVRVSTSRGIDYSFSVPYEEGSSKRYWHVFDLDEYGNMIPINTLISSNSGLE